jgi:membrane protein implicated in regulation of membrane protease activity
MILIIVLILALIFLPWPWSLVVIALAAVLELSLWFFGVRYSRRRRAQVGVQTMIGTLGEAVTALAPHGQVKIDGEIWEAEASGNARAGDAVRVTGIHGLTLDVEKADSS